MKKAWIALPGDPDTNTGGYAYARSIVSALSGLGWSLDVVALSDTFPFPSVEDHAEACEKLAQLPADRPVLVDGLAFGALSNEFLNESGHRWIALVHHPLALEHGLTERAAEHLQILEKAALSTAEAVIVTSPTTARCLVTDYGVPEQLITVACPGTAPAARAQGNGALPLLLTVATLTPRKGYDVLVKALARIKSLSWTALWVGSINRDPVTANALQQTLLAFDLGQRIDIAGEVDADTLERYYDRANIFVLASRHEGYGMVFAEALAHGLPIVGCAAGAVPETIPRDAGILVPANDATALAEALTMLLTQPRLRLEMADAAWRHAGHLPSWKLTATKIAAVLEKFHVS